MYRLLLLLSAFLFFLCFGCKNKKAEIVSTVDNQAKVSNAIEVYDYESLKPMLHTKTDTTYAVNFWAMWCKPCVKELPYFEEYASKNKDSKTKVILISLDFPKDIETKLKPFLKQKKISSKVVLLDDADANSWINKIDPNWSGAIPFTIIFNKEKRAFFERSFHSLKDLEDTIKQTIKQ